MNFRTEWLVNKVENFKETRKLVKSGQRKKNLNLGKLQELFDFFIREMPVKITQQQYLLRTRCLLYYMEVHIHTYSLCGCMSQRILLQDHKETRLRVVHLGIICIIDLLVAIQMATFVNIDLKYCRAVQTRIDLQAVTWTTYKFVMDWKNE